MMPTRREVLSMLAASAAAAAIPVAIAGPAKPASRKGHVFSKHLQWLDYGPMAETAAGIGFDGVDLTVRPKGHVLPENVQRHLPRAVEAIRRAGLKADRITTAVTDPDDPLSLRILETASDLGIRIYRMGWLKYDRERPIPKQLDAFRGRLEKLARLNERLGIHGAYQNHVGTGVGSAVWDAWLLVKDLDPRWLGIRFDVRHAMAEGIESWELGLQLVAPHVRSLDVKDFRWTENDGEWMVESVPLGEGAVRFPYYLDLLEKWRIEADMTLHLEYPLGGADKGRSELTVPADEVTAAMQRDLDFLRGLLES
jgi:sugar phosphate isomerase/epimerase